MPKKISQFHIRPSLATAFKCVAHLSDCCQELILLACGRPPEQNRLGRAYRAINILIDFEANHKAAVTAVASEKLRLRQSLVESEMPLAVVAAAAGGAAGPSAHEAVLNAAIRIQRVAAMEMPAGTAEELHLAGVEAILQWWELSRRRLQSFYVTKNHSRTVRILLSNEIRVAHLASPPDSPDDGVLWKPDAPEHPREKPTSYTSVELPPFADIAELISHTRAALNSLSFLDQLDREEWNTDELEEELCKKYDEVNGQLFVLMSAAAMVAEKYGVDSRSLKTFAETGCYFALAKEKFEELERVALQQHSLSSDEAELFNGASMLPQILSRLGKSIDAYEPASFFTAINYEMNADRLRKAKTADGAVAEPRRLRWKKVGGKVDDKSENLYAVADVILRWPEFFHFNMQEKPDSGRTATGKR